MKNSKFLQLNLCLIVATVLALTSHIYLSEWLNPVLDSMKEGLHTKPYSNQIIAAAYGTAFITVALIVFLYYHTQHLLSIKSQLLKGLLVACILLELKGNLFRLPIMDLLVNYSYGMQGIEPFIFVGLNIIDKWVPSLFLALSLVYLCPQKYEGDL